jgi:anti-sigma-K factor RskA
MSDRNTASPDDPAADLAAEFVLGVIEGADRAAAIERMRNDPIFRAEVEAWERRLSSLLDQVAPQPLPGHVKARIWDRIAAAVTPEGNVVALPRARIWNRPGIWRLATAASLAALALTVFLRAPPAPAPARAPTQIAQAVLATTLTSPRGEPLYVATLERAGVALVPVNVARYDGRFPELWIIRAGAKPAPVGMIDNTRPVALTLKDARASDVLAISLEPAGGSRTGAPTGPVIATGALRQL